MHCLTAELVQHALVDIRSKENIHFLSPTHFIEPGSDVIPPGNSLPPLLIIVTVVAILVAMALLLLAIPGSAFWFVYTEG